MSETLNRDTSYAPATELVAALAAGRISALELADEAIARIELRDGAINAVVVRDFDRARDAARAADAALARGERRPLLGLPMTVKESHDVAGLRTTWGLDWAQDHVAEADSIGVSRLKAAGAVILGKTNIPTALADWQCMNPIYGRTNNPFDVSRTPGGSSGGSAAALAAGFVALEFGSDVGGAIRIPAAFCGLFGHRPSYDLIPRRGHGPAGSDGAPPPMAVVGPLARTPGDLGLALDVLAGPGPEQAIAYRLALPPARHSRLADFRVLLLTAHPVAQLDHEVRAALEAVGRQIETLGVRVARESSRLPDLTQAHDAFMAILDHAVALRDPDPPKLSAAAWVRMLDDQLAFQRRWAALFETFDVVLAPAFGSVAYPHDTREPNLRTLMIDGARTPYFTQLAWPGMAALANLPATAVPIGRTKAGLPIGMQVIGPYLEDRTTLGFAELFEREFGGFQRPPGF